MSLCEQQNPRDTNAFWQGQLLDFSEVSGDREQEVPRERSQAIQGQVQHERKSVSGMAEGEETPGLPTAHSTETGSRI